MVLPFLAALAPAIGGVAQAIGQNSANKANIQAAEDQMDFQRHMSNTAYRRGMRDMKKAGLNPILAGRLGGASSPAGAMPNIQNTMSGMAATGAAVSQAYNNSALTAAQVEQTKAQTKLINVQANKADTTQTLYDIAQDFLEANEGRIRKAGKRLLTMLDDVEEAFDTNSARTADEPAGLKTQRKRIDSVEDIEQYGTPGKKRFVQEKPWTTLDDQRLRRLTKKHGRKSDKYKRHQRDRYQKWKEKHYGN